MRSPALLAMALALLTSAAQAQIPPVLTIHFDKDFHGVGPQGAVVRGTPVGKPVLVPGKWGQALKSGSGTGFVDYPTANILNPRGGTVEMWVCPLDWTADDGKFHAFFDARGQGALYLYKFCTGTNLLMLTAPDVRGPFASSQISAASWKPGQWHFIAGTWSSEGVRAYVDGQPAAGPVEGSLPAQFRATFRIGDQAWQFPRSTSSLVDEVRIYDRPLTPAHIAAHFRGDYAFTVPLSKDSVSLDYRIDPLDYKATVHVTTGADVDLSRTFAQLAVVPTGQPMPQDAIRLPMTDGLAVAALALPSRQPGSYQVLACLSADGRKVEIARGLIIPATPWLGNRLGLADTVLPPWTPLEVTATGRDGQSVRVGCWGRTYHFDRSPFPTQVVSAGQELLARPMTLSVGHGDQPSLTIVRRSATRAELAGQLAGAIHARVTAEYDGLLLFEISCPRPSELADNRLSLDIPMRASRAIYRHRWAPTWTGVAGNVPPQQGVVESTPFVPFAWLGDNDRGLFWFCESDQMWPNAHGADAIQFVRSGEEVILRLNLLAKGQKLPEPWNFVFGLQATPVKPIPKDWRKWRMSPGRNANIEIVWPMANKRDSFSQFGYPEAADPSLFQKYIDGLHGKGLKAVPYLCLTFLTGGVPEWQFLRSRWDMNSADPSIPAAGWHHSFNMVSPVGPGYADFIMFRTKEFLDRYGIDGTYHDQTHPYSAAAVEAGVGYLRDGKPQRGHPILGYRELYRRNYAILRSLPRETFSMAHMSGKLTLPILAYEDAYLDGENFRGVVKDSYLDVLPLDAFRTEFMGRQWGIMPFFLPEFDPKHAAQVEPTRGLMALLMLHDVSLWPIWCNLKEANRALAALDEFGYVAAEFIPYFASVPPATTNMANVYVSAYKRPSGQVLLIVGNLSKEDRQGEVRIEAGTLGMRLGKIVTWPQKEPVASQGGRLQLDVPRLGYRMLLVDQAR